MITVLVTLLLPSAGPLVGMLMLGNLMRESGVVERLSQTVQNELMNIVTIFLGVTVGATANAETFLQWGNHKNNNTRTNSLLHRNSNRNILWKNYV